MSDVEDYNNYVFERGDIVDKKWILSLFKKYNFDGVIHLAESHVDRSISNPMEFIMTNVVGTLNLLNVQENWSNFDGKLFYHVSTDEVYGSLGPEGCLQKVLL